MNSIWVGKDEYQGVPSQHRPDVRPPPDWRLEMVAAMERPRHLQVSPDGAQLLFILDRDSSDLWSMTVAGGAPRRLTVDRAITGFWDDTPGRWSPDGTRIAYATAGEVRVVPAAGGPSRTLVEARSPLWVDDRRLLVRVERERRTRLAVLDADDPWPQPLERGEGDCSQPAVSPDRRWVVYTFSPPGDRNRSDIRTVDLTSGETRSLTGSSRFHDHSPVISPDGRRIAFVSERPGWNELFLIDPDGGREQQLTTARADFSEPRWDQGGSKLLAIRTRAGHADLVVVDAVTGEVAVLATGGVWAFPCWLPDGSVVAAFEDHRTPPRLCRVQLDGTVTVLFDPAPAPLRRAPHISAEEVTYRSLDGLEIPAFLFKPAAAATSRVGAVVYPHGGPTGAYKDDWDGIAQYFLDKGYAWMAPNFRGSTGYGLDFERADHGVWGVADTDDCLAAADYLTSLDWIDPRRLAIFGASYGSYMALASLVRDDRSRFACAVAKYGDSDILTSWAQGDREGSEDLERMMGHPSGNPRGYRAGSPIHGVAGIDKPLLVVHGEKDGRVHPAQSEELVEALRRADKTFEYVTYPTEGHGLLRREPMLHFYKRLERFLDWYLM